MLLHSPELGTLTNIKKDLIDSFHGRLLGAASINIMWPMKLSTKNVYETTKTKPWNQIIGFGHFMRLPKNSPVQFALKN